MPAPASLKVWTAARRGHHRRPNLTLPEAAARRGPMQAERQGPRGVGLDGARGPRIAGRAGPDRGRPRTPRVPARAAECRPGPRLAVAARGQRDEGNARPVTHRAHRVAVTCSLWVMEMVHSLGERCRRTADTTLAAGPAETAGLGPVPWPGPWQPEAWSRAREGARAGPGADPGVDSDSGAAVGLGAPNRARAEPQGREPPQGAVPGAGLGADWRERVVLSPPLSVRSRSGL